MRRDYNLLPLWLVRHIEIRVLGKRFRPKLLRIFLLKFLNLLGSGGVPAGGCHKPLGRILRGSELYAGLRVDGL